jgi:hypothetical protein
MQLALAREVSSPATDLLAIYLPGLDIAQHALLGQGARQSPEQAPSASAMARRLDAVRAYYVCLDRLLGDALQSKANDLVIVATEPGRVEAAAPGLLGMTGAGSRPDAVVSAKATDVAPTVLYSLGVPLSRALAGAPLTGLLTDGFVQRHPIRTTASYGPPAARLGSRSGQPLDQEAIDRLRSLGYVK